MDSFAQIVVVLAKVKENSFSDVFAMESDLSACPLLQLKGMLKKSCLPLSILDLLL